MPTPSVGREVVVGLDSDTVNTLAKEALKASMNNERALWQKFQAEKSFEEMAQEMAKLR